jgi:hypothetical protein
VKEHRYGILVGKTGPKNMNGIVVKHTVLVALVILSIRIFIPFST